MKVQLVDGPINPGKAGKARYRTVRKDGRSIRFRVIDADSPDFAADFHASFAASVRRARDDNRKLKGD